MLERALERLRDEYAASGKADVAKALLPYLTDSTALPPYRAVAADLGLSEGAVKVAVHRLRQRYGAILRAEVAETVADEQEVDAELRELLQGGLDVSLHHCSRHPAAAAVRGHCPACLLEAAFASPQGMETATGSSFTIQVPLGESEAALCFSSAATQPHARLLRLKRWRTPAPAGFIEGFERLKTQLEEWRPPTIVLPVTAWVDAMGCPSVVTDFRQGMPLLESVRSGWLHPERARSGLRQLQDILDAAHQRGVTHGSVVPGNVFSARPDGAPYLLDFGFGVLLSDPSAPFDWAAADREGLARIQAQLERISSESR